MYREILNQKVKELSSAIDDFKTSTIPKTPEPRIRKFTIVEGRIYIERHAGSIVFCIDNEPCSLLWPNHTIDEILKISECKPRNILRIIRRIEAATEWFKRRAEGRRRMAEEILRQQKKFVETLEAEAALMSLGK